MLPSLLKDAGILEALKQRVEEIASLEEKRSELLIRSARLANALRSASALDAPAQELETLNASKLQAEAEQQRLDKAYSDAKRLEEIREELTRLEVKIERARDRKARLISAVKQAEALSEKRAIADQLQEELTGATRATLEARSKLSAATRIEELRREAARLKEELLRLSHHRSRLGSLLQDSLNIKELRATVSGTEEKLAEGRLRLEVIREELSRHEQSDALIDWAVARRDADTRASINRVIAECKTRSDEAREKKVRSEQQEKAAKRQMLTAGLITALGLATLVAAFVISLVLLALTPLIVGAGMAVAIRAKRQSSAAANERHAAEADISRFDRKLEGEKVRHEMLASSQPRDLAACRTKLLESGLAEPESPQEAEQRARALVSRDKNTVLSILNTEQTTVQGIEKRLIEQQERLRSEEQNLDRQLVSLELTTADNLQDAIDQVERQHTENVKRQKDVSSETAKLALILPAEYEVEGINQDLKSCEDKEKAVELEIAGLRAEISSSEKQIQELISNEGAADLEATQALLSDIEIMLEGYGGEKGKLEQLASELAKIVPAGWTSAELYNQLTNSTGRLRLLETDIAEKQARLDAEQERISLTLQAEAATDLEHAHRILGELKTDEEILATQIGELWEQDKDSFLRWEVPYNTQQAREALAAAVSTVKANMSKANEEIARRPEIEQQKAQTETEIDNYNVAIASNHAQLDLLFQEVGFENPPAIAERNCNYEKEILKEAQLRLALEDLDEIKLAYQKAIESKATDISRAEQSESNSAQARRSAEMRLAAMGVKELAGIDVETISSHLPDFPDVKASDRVYFQNEINGLTSDLAVLDSEAQQLERSLQTIRGELDIDLCKRELDEFVRRNTVCQHAGRILDRVRENILQSVLPNTLNYMRALLPLLTCGRYHDAELDDETYKIRVWDNRAGEYIEKDIFSGATQDQFSLALRLAFALATLPEGLGAQPKFIFLDEPTAGFDGERREAFINLLKEGYLSERFDQIFLVTPEGIFNHNPLPDYIRIVRGRIMTDTLSAKASSSETHLHSIRAL